ncbi:MAG: GNAT family N-acetyltransferase, partial [Alphaproteobacteria bacterium]|nr:GNAT family N-acetyltransferase [Alphaproteobacteria bacterium]
MTSGHTKSGSDESILVPADVSHSLVLATLHGEGFDQRWSADAFADLLSQPTVGGWIAGPNEPVGFILVQTAAGESEILTLVVAAAHRRCGIARQLIKQAIAHGKTEGASVFHL